MNPSRRAFLKKGLGGTAAASLSLPLTGLLAKEAFAAPSPFNQWPGRVVVNYNQNATSGATADLAVIKTMVDDAVKLLTGKQAVGEAWKSIFPATLTLSSKIAIKVNLLNTNTPTHAYVVKGVADGLQQMMLGGTPFPASGITLYDNYSFADAGYTTTLFPGITMLRQGDWDWERHGDGAWNNAAYADALYSANFLINMPVLKGHGDSVGSVTLGFKNHYGTYTPGCYAAGGDHHSYLQALNCTGPVYAKTVLTVISAIFAQREGSGPDGTPQSFLTYARTLNPGTSNVNPNTVILSTDPVTAEFQGIKIQKIQAGKTYAAADMPSYLRASAGISGVLNTTYNIGVLDESGMDKGEIINGTITRNLSTAISDGLRPLQNKSIGSLRVLQNPATFPVKFEIQIPAQRKPASLTIFLPSGKAAVRLKINPAVPTQTIWDGRNSTGDALAAGRYLAELKTEKGIITTTFLLLN